MSEHAAEKDAAAALYRLFDQAFHTAGDDQGRKRASRDYLIVREALGIPVTNPGDR